MNCSVIGLAAVAVASSAVAQDRVRLETDTLACRDLNDVQALDRAMILWAVRGTIDYPRMRDEKLASGDCKYLRTSDELTVGGKAGDFTCLRYVGDRPCYWADRPKLRRL